MQTVCLLYQNNKILIITIGVLSTQHKDTFIVQCHQFYYEYLYLYMKYLLTVLKKWVLDQYLYLVFISGTWVFGHLYLRTPTLIFCTVSVNILCILSIRSLKMVILW